MGMRTAFSKGKMKDFYLRRKRIQDLGISIILLCIFSPLFVLLPALILWESPGASPIFAQQRVGKQGKIFTMYKFRSMCPGAELWKEELRIFNEMDGPVFKMKNDPRITKLGYFLRKTGLDELPQLLNVLRGEMSIVGPRPALPEEAEKYNEKQKLRLSIEPGITCYWQIQPRRNSLRFEEWLDLDLKYLQDRCFYVDWKIMFATMKAIARMDGE